MPSLCSLVYFLWQPPVHSPGWICYPLYFVVIASVSDALAVSSGRVTWKPVGLTLAGYRKILSFSRIWIAYRYEDGMNILTVQRRF